MRFQEAFQFVQNVRNAVTSEEWSYQVIPLRNCQRSDLSRGQHAVSYFPFLGTPALLACHRRLYDQGDEGENRLGTHRQLSFIHFDFSFRRAKLVTWMYH